MKLKLIYLLLYTNIINLIETIVKINNTLYEFKKKQKEVYIFF